MNEYNKLKNLIFNNYKNIKNYNEYDINDSEEIFDYNMETYVNLNFNDINEAINIITNNYHNNTINEDQICTDYFTVDISELYNKINNSCSHYINYCRIVSPCCNKIFDCYKCHDEKSNHKININEVKYLQCKKCEFIQTYSKRCIVCLTKFSDYYCRICKIYDSSFQAYFHCNKCKKCIRGEKRNYLHCIKCNCCIKNIKCHICIEDRLNNNCPICFEKYEGSINEKIIIMKCGHNIHYECYLELLNNTYKCPICLKSITDTDKYFEPINNELTNTVIHSELLYDIEIFCNDCHSTNIIKNNFVGLKCPTCSSFNTRKS